MGFSAAVVNTFEGTGSRIRVIGTYTNTGGGTGGDVTTNLNVVEDFTIKPKGSVIIATASVINETLPLTNTGGAVTIVTSADEVGYWEAWGY